ncbi:hypothetical protein ABK040_009355 [Willaertia magna]
MEKDDEVLEEVLDNNTVTSSGNFSSRKLDLTDNKMVDSQEKETLYNNYLKYNKNENFRISTPNSKSSSPIGLGIPNRRASVKLPYLIKKTSVDDSTDFNFALPIENEISGLSQFDFQPSKSDFHIKSIRTLHNAILSTTINGKQTPNIFSESGSPTKRKFTVQESVTFNTITTNLATKDQDTNSIITDEENTKQHILSSIIEKLDGNAVNRSKSVPTLKKKESFTERELKTEQFRDDYCFIQNEVKTLMKNIKNTNVIENEYKSEDEEESIEKKRALKPTHKNNTFFNDLPLSLQSKIQELKNNPTFKQTISTRKRKNSSILTPGRVGYTREKKPIVQTAQNQIKLRSTSETNHQKQLEKLGMYRLSNKDSALRVVHKLLKKQTLIDKFDELTMKTYNELLMYYREIMWKSIVRNSLFISKLVSKLPQHQEAVSQTISPLQLPNGLNSIVNNQFYENSFVCRMKWKINRKRIAAELVRNAFETFYDTKLIVKAVQKFRTNMKTCKRLIVNYFEIRKARINLLKLQFEKYEIIRNELVLQNVAKQLVRTKSSNRMVLSQDILKEVNKIESQKSSNTLLAPNAELLKPTLFATPPKKTKPKNSPEKPQSQKESLIPEEIKMQVISENYMRRRKEFLNRTVLKNEKPWFKCLLSEKEMLDLVEKAQNLASEKVRAKSKSPVFMEITFN